MSYLVAVLKQNNLASCFTHFSTDLIWLQSLFKDLHLSISRPPTLWCDNLSTIHLSANQVLHFKTKHVEIDIYFVCDLVLQKHLTVCHLLASAQIADIFTKLLSASWFLPLKRKLNVCSSNTICLRGVLRELIDVILFYSSLLFQLYWLLLCFHSVL